MRCKAARHTVVLWLVYERDLPTVFRFQNLSTEAFLLSQLDAVNNGYYNGAYISNLYCMYALQSDIHCMCICTVISSPHRH